MYCAMVCRMATHTDPDLIGSAEVCRLLHKNQATIGRWVTSGRLTPVHKLPGKNGAYLFNRTDIEQLRTELTEASA
jgi:predicted site-specific integrase-resolvase